MLQQPAITKTEAARTQFLVPDFLKMFLGALLCGLIFSLIATGVTLAIVSVAESADPAAVVATPAD